METLKPLAEICAPDPRQTAFVLRHRITGEIRARTLVDVYQEIAEIDLTADVPDQVRSAFATTRNLMLYSWFVYAFGVVAELQALATLELALKRRLDPSDKRRRLTLLPLMREAIDRQLLVDDGVIDVILPLLGTPERQASDQVRLAPGSDPQQYVKRLAKSMSFIRNELAHGTFMLWPHRIGTLHLIARLINQAYTRTGA